MVYKVVFRMKTPIMDNAPMHFDAIIGATQPSPTPQTKIITRDTRARDVPHIPLPIDSAKIGRAWVYCCSVCLFSDDVYFVGAQAARCNEAYCKEAYFYVSSAKATRLRSALRRVACVGACGDQDYGMFLDFEMLETDMDWRDCLVQNGRAMRNLPESFLRNQANDRVACRPPYWLPDNREYGVKAGATCRLREDVYLQPLRKSGKSTHQKRAERSNVKPADPYFAKLTRENALKIVEAVGLLSPTGCAEDVPIPIGSDNTVLLSGFVRRWEDAHPEEESILPK